MKVRIIFIPTDKKVKGEVPAHAVRAYGGGGERGMAPLILNLGNTFFFREGTPAKSQSRSGLFGVEKNILPLPGFV